MYMEKMRIFFISKIIEAKKKKIIKLFNNGEIRDFVFFEM